MTDDKHTPTQAFRDRALSRLDWVDYVWASGLSGLTDEAFGTLEAELTKLENEAREIGYSEVALMCHKLAELVQVARLQLEPNIHEVETLGALAINFAVMLVRGREQSTPGLDLPNFAAEIDAAVAEARRLHRHEESLAHAESEGADKVNDLGGQYDQLAVAAADIFLEAVALPPEERQGLLMRWDALAAALRDLEIVPMQRRADRYQVLAQRAADVAGNQVELRTDLQHLQLSVEHARLMDEVLVELIENAVEHGIERQRARTVVGKQPWGIITVWARRDGDEVVVEVQDDGRGIDHRELRRQFPEADEEELWSHAEDTSFSTRPKSRAGARGEGLSRVRLAVDAIGGTLTIRSVISAGVTAEIRLPAPEATIDVWTFPCDDAWYAVPARHEVELVDAPGEHPLQVCGLAAPERRSEDAVQIRSSSGASRVLDADEAPRRATLSLRCSTPDSHSVAILDDGQRPVVLIRRVFGD